MSSEMNRRVLKIGLIVALMASPLVVQLVRGRVPNFPGVKKLNNPTSKVIINTTNEKYDRVLSDYLLSVTNSNGDTVQIDIGNRLGVANSIEEDVLWFLAPTVRMHPKAKKIYCFLVYVVLYGWRHFG